jgi:hypothetical protein
MADKQITPKAPSGQAKATEDSKAAARVTQKKVSRKKVSRKKVSRRKHI